jgi:CheY-like chemotaxis protein
MASLSQGSKIIEEIEAIRPDIIVLDLMLPDVDGWQLLAELHEHPASRDIPLIVCSVVREEDLALALGATTYLPKPVQCHQLIAALDQTTLMRAAAGDRQASGHSA